MRGLKRSEVTLPLHVLFFFFQQEVPTWEEEPPQASEVASVAHVYTEVPANAGDDGQDATRNSTHLLPIRRSRESKGSVVDRCRTASNVSHASSQKTISRQISGGLMRQVSGLLVGSVEASDPAVEEELCGNGGKRDPNTTIRTLPLCQDVEKGLETDLRHDEARDKDALKSLEEAQSQPLIVPTNQAIKFGIVLNSTHAPDQHSRDLREQKANDARDLLHVPARVLSHDPDEELAHSETELEPLLQSDDPQKEETQASMRKEEEEEEKTALGVKVVEASKRSHGTNESESPNELPQDRANSIEGETGGLNAKVIRDDSSGSPIKFIPDSTGGTHAKPQDSPTLPPPTSPPPTSPQQGQQLVLARSPLASPRTDWLKTCAQVCNPCGQ